MSEAEGTGAVAPAAEVQAPTATSAGASDGTGAPAEPTPAPVPAEQPGPGDGGVAEQPGVVEPPVEAGPPAWETFEWSGWDGESLDSFTEDIRPWIERALDIRSEALNKKHSEALESEVDKAARWQRLFNDALDGEDDPRIAEEQARVEEAMKLLAERDEALTKMGEEREALNKRIEAFVEENTNNYIEWFSRTYPDITGDDDKMNAVIDLAEELDLGAEWDFAANLYKMGDDAMAAAKAGKQRGVPPEALMSWVEMSLASAKKKAAPKPSASEALATDDGRPSVPGTKPPAGKTKAAPQVRSAMDAAIREAVRSTMSERKRR